MVLSGPLALSTDHINTHKCTDLKSSTTSLSEEVSKLNDQIFELQKQVKKSHDDNDILKNKLIET